MSRNLMKHPILRSHLRAAIATGPDRLFFKPRIELITSRMTAFSAAGTASHQAGI